MPSVRQVSETEAQPHPQYISLLSSHVHDTRAHYSGHDDHQPLHPSFFPPSSFWTGAEKDAFFHGLAIHSRLRPDLIAGEIKTKNVTDVCIYLDMLEEGSAQNFYRRKRKDIPAAQEVSDAWLTFEEDQAAAVVLAEPGYEAQALECTREEEKREFKTSIRARKGGARTASNERDREGEKKRKIVYDHWLEGREAEWRAQDALRSMDSVALKAMHHVLREEVETKDEDEDTPEVKQEDLQGAAELSAVLSAGNVIARPASLPAGLIPFDDDLIDPALRAISQASAAPSVAVSVDPGFPPTRVRPATHTPPGPVSNNGHGSLDSHTSLYPNTPPFQHIQQHESLSSPLVQPVPPKLKASSSGEVDLADGDMSPTSRRRLLKRLYMRRKRAEKSGTVADESSDMLKRGRKRKKRRETRGRKQKAGPAPEDIVEDGDDEEGDEQNEQAGPAATIAAQGEAEQEAIDEGEGEYRHRNRSGRTRRERMLQSIAEMGFTSERLNEEGLGLLHLGGVARLMRFFDRLNDAPPSVSSEISIDLIKMLNALVVKFTTEVVHRAIVSREQERLAKMHTKVWRSQSKLVTPINVAHAVALTRGTHASKDEYFEEMAQELDLLDDEEVGEDEAGADEDQVTEVDKGKGKSVEDAVDEEDGEQSESEAEDETAEQQSPLFPDTHPNPLPLHRAMFTPFVRMLGSTSSIEASSALDMSLFMPWPSTSSSMQDPPTGVLMPQDVDEDLLLSELLEEDELDRHDLTASAAHEEKLWAHFRRVQTHSPLVPQEPAQNPQPLSVPPSQPPDTPPAATQPQQPQDVAAPASQSQISTAFRAERPARSSQSRKRKRLEDDPGEDAGGRLRFMEPGGRIKSSVYVYDSDE